MNEVKDYYTALHPVNFTDVAIFSPWSLRPICDALYYCMIWLIVWVAVKRQKPQAPTPQAPTPQAPIRNCRMRKVANAKGLNRNTNLT